MQLRLRLPPAVTAAAVSRSEGLVGRRLLLSGPARHAPQSHFPLAVAMAGAAGAGGQEFR